MKLLVSVRSRMEAVAALEGGCDIIDIKEPARGPLGAASGAVVAEIIQEVAGRVPVSAAGGEVLEVLRTSPARQEPRPHGSRPIGLAFVKLGPAGLSRERDWPQIWRRGFERVLEDCAPAGCVAVAYADAQNAEAPEPESILNAMLSAGSLSFQGFLIDTFDKSAGTLLDWLPVPRLQAIADRLRESGRFLALAGRLSLVDLELLRNLQPDVIAIRSAACAQRDRQMPVEAERVRRFRNALHHRVQPIEAGVRG